jgi:hypothetical protein
VTIANVNIKKVLFRRGNTIQNDNYVGVFGEVSVDTQANTLRVHNGVTAGGTRLATYAELTDLAVGNIDLTGYTTTAQITAANTEIAKLRANITAANAAIVSNYNFLLSNAGVAHTEINGLRADITAANVAWTANAAIQATAINSINANLGSFQTYANATFTGGGGGSNYSNTNVAAYLTGSITAGNIIPTTNAVFTLGNTTHWWKELYVGSNTIYIGGVPLSIDPNQNLLIDGNIVQGNVDAVNSNVSVIDANIGAYQRWANINAAVQTTSINTTSANIGAYQIYANANAAAQTIAINTINANVAAANAAITAVTAAWTANAGTQATDINALRANITAANSAIDAVTTAWTANAGTQATEINSLRANVTAANTAIATLQTQVYSNVNTAAYLTGAITTGNITAANVIVENNAVILGNLRVAGTQTTVNASTLNITDLWVTVADGATQASDAHGAGLRVDGALANIAYSSVSDSFEFNKQIVVGNVKFSDTTRLSGNTITLPNTQGFNWYFNDPMIGSDTVTLYMNGLTTGYDSWALTTGNGTNSWMLDSSTQEFSLFNGGVDGGKLVFGTAANAGVRSSIDDIELKSSVGNVFIRANANPWTFSENGNLILPTRMNFISSPAISGTGIIFGDGSYQNTAWTGNVARLTNNGYNVTLGTDGTLTIVNAITTPGGQYFVVTSDTSTEMSWANAVQDPNTDVYSGIGSNSDGTAISVASTDSEGSWVFKTWDFDMSGNLTIPGNINYANGQSILSGITGGGGSTGDLIISGNIITSNDGNTFVNFDSDNELVLGTNTSSNVKIFVDDSNGGNLKTWTFSTDGSLIVPKFGTINFVDPVIGGFGTPNTTTRTPGNRIVLYPSFNGSGLVDYAIGIDGDVQWYSIPDSNARFEWYAGNNKVLSLSGDGILQLPAGGDIVDSTGTSVLGGGGGNVSLPGLATSGTGTSNVAGNQVYALSINTESESDDEIQLKVYAGGDNAGPAISIGQDNGGSHRANVIAIGNYDVGYNSLPGGVYIGYAAGYNNAEQPQGLHSIAIGSKAAYTFATNNSITLNATGNDLTPDESGLFIKPVRAEEYDDAILYYNPTSGEVTYANNTGGGATVSNTAPTAVNGRLWYNTDDGRMYVRGLDTWIDASPAVVPGNMVGYGQDGNITLNEDARINYANGTSIINSVYGDSQVAEFLSDYTGNIAKIGASPLSIAAASVRLTSDNETWTFAPDGVIALPNGMTIESYGTLGVNAGVSIGGDDTRITIDDNGAPPGFSITANATGGMASRTWLFGPDGNISFPDGSTQTTAYTGGGGGTGNALVNGGYTVALEANGVVTIGANATISNEGEFRLWATDTDITVYRNGQDGYGVKAGNIETFTDNALRTLTNSNGFEIKTGNIIIPNDKGVVFANGVNILSTVGAGAYGNTQVASYLLQFDGDIEFTSSTARIGNVDVITVMDSVQSPVYRFVNGSKITGIGNNLNIRTTTGVPGGPVTKISDNQGWDENNVGTDLPTTGGTGSGLTVDVVDGGSFYSIITINNPGSGYTNGDVLTVTRPSVSEIFSISVPVYDWQFGANGATTFSSNLIIGSNPINPGTVITQANALMTVATTGTAATYIGWSEFEYEPGNIALVAFNDTAGGAVAIQTGATTGPEAFNEWIFDADGTLTFPTGGNLIFDSSATSVIDGVTSITANGNVTAAQYNFANGVNIFDTITGVTSINSSVSTLTVSDASGDYTYGALNYDYAVNGASNSFSIQYSAPLAFGNVDINVGNVTATGTANVANLIISGTAPGTLLGSAGDTVGMVRVDSNYIYYCTSTFVPASWTVGWDGSVGNTLFLAQGAYPTPQVGWTVTQNIYTFTIDTVTDDGYGHWQITWTGTAYGSPNGGTATLTNPNPATIWSRTPLAATTYANTNVAAYLTTANISTTGNITAGNVSATRYNFANGVNILSNVVSKTTGSWTVTTGTNTYSIQLAENGTYQIWVDCNIPNGILAYNATATVTNGNVPIVGVQYAWVYNGGGTPIDFVSIPNQFVGTANTIVRSSVSPSATTNRLDFGINNASGGNVTVRYGYVKIS